MNLEHSRVPIPGTKNVRDLGGYPADDGLAVARRRLYRAEALAMPGASEMHAIWDDANAHHYAAIGVKTVVDLRSEYEAAATPSAWPVATGAEVVSLPIAEGGEGANTNYMRWLLDGWVTRIDADDMARFYIETLDRRATVFADAVQLLANVRRLPLLAHCSAGKDRTGMLIALVLGVLGTPREVIVEDYALTGVFRPNRVLAYADVFGDAGIELDDVRALFESPAAAMEATLDHIDERYGGADGYLVDAGGLDPQKLDGVRAALLSHSTVTTAGN